MNTYSARLKASQCRRARLAAIAFIFGILAMPISPSNAMADEDAFFPGDEYAVSYAFGKAYEVRVTREMQAKSPQWKKAEQNPPVSARKALEVAGELADKLIGKKERFKRYLEEICLKPMEDGCVWIVRFSWVFDGGSSGQPDHFYVVVLMDGKAVQPEVRDGVIGDLEFGKNTRPSSGNQKDSPK